jgi:lysophospholipase L1-like esterase
MKHNLFKKLRTASVIILGMALLLTLCLVNLYAATVTVGNFTVDYVIQSDWGNGATINVILKNNGPAINGWTVGWTFPGNQTITNMWNASYTQSGAFITAKNLSYNASLSTGGSQSFGFNINYSGSNAAPTNFTVNSSSTTTPTPTRTTSPTARVTPTFRPSSTPTRRVTPTRSATPTPTRPATPTPTGNTITKIMPLGDSITDGFTVAGGYRIKLWSSIQSIGKTIDFVGSMSNGPAELGDKNHEGHSGWRIDQIDASINGWMDTYKPRIVLLHIGTNDIGQNYNISGAPTRLSALIDKICAKLPVGGKLYVAKIIPLNGQTTNITNFNNQIPGIVQSKVNSGKPVYMVDMYSALTLSDLADGVHPNRTGYDKMADVWFNAIRSDL